MPAPDKSHLTIPHELMDYRTQTDFLVSIYRDGREWVADFGNERNSCRGFGSTIPEAIHNLAYELNEVTQ